MSEIIRRIADDLYLAERTRTPIPPVRDRLPPGDLDAAYAVQRLNVERGIDAGRRPSGRKIGLTSPAVQRQLGVDQPDYGMLFADMARADAEPIALSDVLQPKAEAEIAFVLERDLPHEVPTMADLLRAIAFAVPAIEVVGSRIAGWDIRITDTIADNASSGLYVLGSRPVRLESFDPVACRMRMVRGGQEVSSGNGAACLGSPLTASLWLARVMARAGSPLQAGDTILSGALGPMVAATAGDAFEVEIEGLGHVRTSFTGEQG